MALLVASLSMERNNLANSCEIFAYHIGVKNIEIV